MFSNTGKITNLESNSEGFNSRQKSVFDELDRIENSRPVNRYTEEQFSEAQFQARKAKVGQNKKQLGDFVGCESIFKTPEAPPPKKRCWINNVPDHKVNPHKWTRYSLSDVSDRDMSEQSNTAAAMAFLRGQGSPIVTDLKIEKIKIAPKFSRVTERKESGDVILRSGDVKPKSQHPLFTATKREMPEYVVGQKPKKSKSSKPTPAEKSDKAIKLEHLFEEDE